MSGATLTTGRSSPSKERWSKERQESFYEGSMERRLILNSLTDLHFAINNVIVGGFPGIPVGS